MFEIFSILWILYIGLYIYALKYKNNSIVDIFWGPIFVIIAFYSYFFESVFSTSQTVMTLLVSAWGIRLFLNIWAKKIWDFHYEDPRYAAWRNSWKYVKIRSFFQVFLLQVLLACLVAIPVFILNFSWEFQENVSLVFLAWSIAIFGLLYEARADWELAGFMKNKQAWDILTTGLRKFHRYPQYFWESVFWFWISCIAAQISTISFVWFAIIFILVRYVSWVPLLEARYTNNKKYLEYSRYTPIFFPDFRKIFFK